MQKVFQSWFQMARKNKQKWALNQLAEIQAQVEKRQAKVRELTELRDILREEYAEMMVENEQLNKRHQDLEAQSASGNYVVQTIVETPPTLW